MPKEKIPRIPIPDSVRDYVFARDRYQCKSCGKTANQVQLHVDHIIPLAQGGENDISNLQTLCLTCNLVKGKKIDGRFQRLYQIQS